MSRLYVSAVVMSMQILFTPLNVLADDAVSKAPDSSEWIYVNETSGLVTSLPIVTSSELIREMDKVSSNLQTRILKLVKAAKAKRFKTRDSVIALAMPGGFIYAAVKKLRHKQAVQQLNNTSAQLNELKKDLLEFRISAYKPEQLAALI